MDKKVTHLSFSIYIQLLSYLKKHSEAIQLVYFLLDLSLEMCEFARAMDYYGTLGLLLEKRKDYDLAIFAFKKMLQLAWLNQTPNNEIHAYLGLAKQNFYSQQLEKAEIYIDRAVNGKLETLTSAPRILAVG
jgi:tetratricopeptide (TPR) repeat protein